MKQQEIDNSIERNILIGLITSKDYFKQVAKVIETRYFKSQYTRIVARWCIEFWEKYEKVPNENITELFQSNSRKIQDETVVDLIDKFIISIKKEFNRGDIFNVKYWFDETEKYFRRQRLDELLRNGNAALDKDDLDGAEEYLNEFRQLKFTEIGGSSLIRDPEYLKKIFAQEDSGDELFRLPGELGKLLGPFSRGDLIAVEAPAKRGKSQVLGDLAVYAYKSRLKVLFIQLEMNERQMTQRLFSNLLGRPRIDDTIQISKFKDGEIISRKEKKKGLLYSMIIRRRKQLMMQYGAGDIHLVCYPSYSVSIKKIKNYINTLEIKEDFLPDVIVVDYADLIGSERNIEHRHQLNNKWIGLRAIAQEKNCLVITASHTNKQTFDRDIRQGDTSEDSRKKNHVALMFALNQRPKEKENNLMRVKVTASRHKRFSDDEVAVTTCFEIGKAFIDSEKVKELKFYEDF